MNKEHCLAFNKMVDCYLNNQINNLFDLEENMKALNNFQAKIDELQKMKDLAQIEHNGIALTILRKYVMSEKFGKLLMRNLIRQYYDLNDEQIKRYEKCRSCVGGDFFITNPLVRCRKGDSFHLGGFHKTVCVVTGNRQIHEDLCRNSLLGLESLSCNPDAGELFFSLDMYAQRQDFAFLLKNAFIDWSDTRLLKEIGSTLINLKPLLCNRGSLVSR